jgi:hypothetical protein
LSENSSVQRYDDAMVAVVMTVDVAWIAYRHWIKFVGLHRCVELSEIAVPSGDFWRGLRCKKPMDGSCAWWVSCKSRSSLRWLSVCSKRWEEPFDDGARKREV